jgi:C-terminal processing protease CtpA/Prc
MAWCVFEHFYSYFDVVEVDWAAELPRALAAAAEAVDGATFTPVLERMVAALQDGHGYVGGPQPRRSFLPLVVRFVGDDLVVLASQHPNVVRGDVLQAIDGRSVASIVTDLQRTTSTATQGFARHRIAQQIVQLATADPVGLQVRRRDGSVVDLSLPRTGSYFSAPDHEKPANGAEVAPGIVYFDLNGAANDTFTAMLPTLAAAKGIVFDLRGYPGAAGVTMLHHVVSAGATSARWIVPHTIGPGPEQRQWQESDRWQIEPKTPHLGGKIAFLTDGRAISYAESVMGIVEAYRLGEIVGSTTAGTNGNVNPFDLPGGFTISWTGMRVLKHDGSRHHGVGIAPTVPVEPTVGGIAAGRDEVLEQAIAVLQQQIDGK